MQTENGPSLYPPEKESIYEVVVIGAGQAGLALGYYLQLQKKNFLLLEAAAQLGNSWQNRYESLRLFTPAEFCSLPGWPLPLPKGSYPSKDDIAVYLQRYAARFQLPVQLNQPVLRLVQAEGIFQIQTPDQVWRARQVVVATGPFQSPLIPDLSRSLLPGVLQLHSAGYRNAAQVPPGKVLVVGGGNSGAQIAAELTQTHEVHLSVRKKLRFAPLRKLGKSIFWWGTKTGALYASPSSLLGQRVQKKSDVIYGLDLQKLLQKGQVCLRPEIGAVQGPDIIFQDGSCASFNSIIWATWFRPRYGWLQIPGALTEDGYPSHAQGVSPVKGLFYLGLPWQRSRSSALLLGAGRDALFIAQRLDKIM